MYWRYQLNEKDSWFPIKANSEEEALSLALASKAKKLTILSTNHLLTDDDSQAKADETRYKGPLYFDLDLKDELGTVIDSARRLVEKLADMRVPAESIEIYLSGSKGLHLMVQPHFFCSPTSSYKYLPLIYKEMARELYVPGLDFSVYSQRKGNAWRIKNVKREDGNFRVPVSYEELKTLTADEYRELVKAPREGKFWTKHEEIKSAELCSMFEESRKKVGEKPKSTIQLSDASLAEIRVEAPACIRELVACNKIKSEVNFNQLAMNLGAYLARTGADENKADSLISLLSNNGKSSKYPTVRARLDHVRGAASYARTTERVVFSCNAMRALLTVRPCDGCPLEQKGAAAVTDEDMGAIQRNEGYFTVMSTGALRRLTNFILDPIDVFSQVQQDGTISRRVATRTKVMRNSELVGTIILGEEAFGSRSSFIKEIQGIPGLVFEGSDSDIQRIKKTFDEEAKEAGEIMITYSCGILIDQVGEVEVRTYVEPDFSLNSAKQSNTHQFQGRLFHRPYLFQSDLPKPEDQELDHALWNLFNCSTPESVAILVGWHVACHFKAHLMHRFQQFPILSLWGNAGAGKSATSSLFSWLNGTDYHGNGQDSGVNLTSITDFALREYCSTSTTIPRLLEEFNQSKIDKRMYTTIHEIIKASWNGETILRGTLGGNKSKGRVGANMIDIPISAPLVVMSEQMLNTDAVRQRSVRLHLTEKIKEGRKENYEQARLGRQKLREFGKALMLKAIQTSSMEVYTRLKSFDSTPPKQMQDRPRYSVQVLLFGLDVCHEMLDSLNLPMSSAMLIECKKALVKAITTPSRIEKPRSEVDDVMTDIGMLITLSSSLLKDNNGRSASPVALQEGVEYLVEYPFVFIDPLFIHAKYMEYSSRPGRRPPVIDRPDQFDKLLREEVYFDEELRHPGFVTRRPVFRLSIERMKLKGLDHTLFSPADIVED